MSGNPLLILAGQFGLLSLFAIGGGVATVPEFHRLAVETHHWMTDREFVEMFALAQLSPGPNILIVTLIGYHVAGLAGAAVTTVAMCGPTCFLAYGVGRVWDRFRTARWRAIIQAGLTPLSVGLLAASMLIIGQAAAISWTAIAIILVSAAVAYRTRINPLWLFAIAAVLGLLGFI